MTDADRALRPESIAVSSGRPHDPGAPVSVAIQPSTIYRTAEDGTNAYLRNEGSDGIRAVEEAVAALEGGGTALAFASGMAAVAAVVESRPSGAVIVAPQAAYSGTVSIGAEQERLGRATVRRVDTADTDAVVAALPGAHLLWLETISNPLLGVPDLPTVLAAAREQRVLTCVDATFSTPLNLRALDLGADVVMHSATKYLSGHSDVLMGLLVTRSADLAAEFALRRRLGGAVPGALECYLALRGMRTLAVRMERAQANALDLAGRLARHPAVARVRYPGLPDDPGHERAAHTGYGAVVSFEVVGDAAHADRVCERVRLITHGTSLGGVESLIERRARYAVDRSYGTAPTLLRLSVGIEHVEDLWSDLVAALDA